MDWFHWVMLSFGILYTVLASVVLMKAIRRGEWQRLYELVVMTPFISGFLLMTLWPTVIQNAWAAWPALRGLYLLSAALFLANWFGFSGWLFNRHVRTRKI